MKMKGCGFGLKARQMVLYESSASHLVQLVLGKVQGFGLVSYEYQVEAVQRI